MCPHTDNKGGLNNQNATNNMAQSNTYRRTNKENIQISSKLEMMLSFIGL